MRQLPQPSTTSHGRHGERVVASSKQRDGSVRKLDIKSVERIGRRLWDEIGREALAMSESTREPSTLMTIRLDDLSSVSTTHPLTKPVVGVSQ